MYHQDKILCELIRKKEKLTKSSVILILKTELVINKFNDENFIITYTIINEMSHIEFTKKKTVITLF